MATIPIVQGPSVRENALQGGFLDTPDVSSGLRSLASGLGAVGNLAEKVAVDQETQRAYATETDVKSKWLAKDAELRKTFRGSSVTGYQQEVTKFWDEAQKTATDDLGQLGKRMVGQSLGQARLQALQSSTHYFAGEIERAQDESFSASKQVEIQRGLTDGRPEAVAISAEILKQRNAQQGALKGWSTEQVQASNLRDLSVLHVGYLQAMQQSDPTAALAYFDANKGEIDTAHHGSIKAGLTTAQAAVEGLSTAHAAFNAHLPEGATPASGTQPIDVVAMRADIEKKFAGKPVSLSAANDALNRLVSDWKTTEAQYQSGYKAKLEAGVAQGKGLAWAQQQPEWGRLDGVTQAAIADHLESKAYSRMLRANAADARSDAASARADRAKGRENFETFVDLQMNPDKLAAMTPQDVKNLALTLSQPQVETLMTQRGRLNTAADVKTAVMDKETFSQLATQFGMSNPQDPDLGASDRAKATFVYANTKMNVDYVLGEAQKAKKAPLTVEEKAEIMRIEMARTVKVNPGWFTQGRWLFGLGGKRDSEVPVVQLTREQVADVEVPAADRKQIVEAMKPMFEKTRSPAFAPNEANIKRIYLTSKSKAGAIVGAAEQ